jgi:hypothetical protein
MMRRLQQRVAPAEVVPAAAAVVAAKEEAADEEKEEDDDGVMGDLPREVVDNPPTPRTFTSAPLLAPGLLAGTLSPGIGLDIAVQPSPTAVVDMSVCLVTVADLLVLQSADCD